MERLGAEEAALEAVVKKQKTEQGGAVALPAVSSRAATFDPGPKQFGRLGYMGGARGAVAVSKFCGETVRAGEQNGAVSPDHASYVRSASQTVMRAAKRLWWSNSAFEATSTAKEHAADPERSQADRDEDRKVCTHGFTAAFGVGGPHMRVVWCRLRPDLWTASSG